MALIRLLSRRREPTTLVTGYDVRLAQRDRLSALLRDKP